LFGDELGTDSGFARRRCQGDRHGRQGFLRHAKRQSDDKDHRSRGTGVAAETTMSDDDAAFRIGELGESPQIVDKVALRPCHRQGARVCMDLGDEQQTCDGAGNVAALQGQPGGTKFHFVSRVPQSMPVRRRRGLCRHYL
jgi:hypothetical protein